MTALPCDPDTLEQVAELVHTVGWGPAADTVGCSIARARRFYRPHLTGLLHRRCRRDQLPHGQGRCRASCPHELCAAERASQKAAWKAEQAGQVAPPAPDPSQVAAVAAQLADGVTWRQLAVTMGRTPTWVRTHWLPLVHDQLLEAAETARPTGRHGTRTGYVADRCRCVPCTQANGGYEHRRAADQARGRPRSRPAPRRAATQLVATAGLRPAARAAGLSPATLKAIVDGDQRTVQAATAIRLTAAPTPAPTLVAAGQARIALRQLARNGWTATDLADALGVTRVRVRGRHVRAARADRLAALIDRRPGTVDADEVAAMLRSLAHLGVDGPAAAALLDLDVALLDIRPPGRVPVRVADRIHGLLVDTLRQQLPSRTAGPAGWNR